MHLQLEWIGQNENMELVKNIAPEKLRELGKFVLILRKTSESIMKRQKLVDKVQFQVSSQFPQQPSCSIWLFLSTLQDGFWIVMLCSCFPNLKLVRTPEGLVQQMGAACTEKDKYQSCIAADSQGSSQKFIPKTNKIRGKGLMLYSWFY